ncbi:cobalamin-dependent protein [Streptomyces sedi]|uniref:Methylaspartate mutase n=1 Tax=Streptomyces sedi TaxID=555059 RepID=A0A5C4VEH5_9ACTN|nr:cobalamin-dependent protein [Streptomyces sedi]TNM34198.1 methylaspartate mutase [Streptomyces sedi]
MTAPARRDAHEPTPSGPGAPGGGAPATPGGTVVLGTVPSDSHTWNLVLLQLLLEECGFEVVNLGPCVPEELLVEECLRHRPELVVISSINGHGYADGLRLAPRVRARPELAELSMIIGGKLGVGGEAADRERGSRALLEAGFDAVFFDAAAADLRRYLLSGERPGEAAAAPALEEEYARGELAGASSAS